MARYKRFTLSYVVNLAVLGLVFSSPVSATVTYNGADGVKNKIFFSNTVQSCTSCHHSDIPYDNTLASSPYDPITVGGTYIYGELRYYAPVDFNFDTYLNATALHPDQVNYPGVTVAQRAYERVVNFDIPNYIYPMPHRITGALGTALYETTTGLSAPEQNLMIGWNNGGYAEYAQPTKQAGAVSSIGKYAATLNATLNRNAWSYNNNPATTTDTRYIFQIKPSSGSSWTDVGSYLYSNAYNTGTKTISDGGIDTSKSQFAQGLSCETSYDVRIYWDFQYSNLVWYDGSIYGGGAGNTASFTTVACPNITTTSLPAATEGVAYQTTISATQKGPSPTYSFFGSSPAGMTINNSGVINWPTPPQAKSDGPVNFTVRLSDGTTTDDQAYTLTVLADDDPPVITSGAPTTAVEANEYTYPVIVSDPDDSSFSYGLTNQPAGMTVSATGVVTWTPGNGVTTSGMVTLSVSDATTTVTEDFTIQVFGVNNPPSITPGATTTATEDTLYSYQLNVSDIDDPNDGTNLAFSLINAPSGMTISNTGLIGWIPLEGVTSSGTFTAEVADGGENGAGVATESITITVTQVNDAPVINSTAGTSVIEESLYSYQLDIIDPDDTDIANDLTITLSNAPTGMVVSDLGLITWTPALLTTTSGAVTVTVADDGANGALPASEIFTVVVNIIDTDNDLVADYNDNCPATSNNDQLNTDGDSQGDACDPDDDNDLMPDSFEIANNLNPLVNDANFDSDGDGVSNYNEYISGGDVNNDDVAPVLSIPVDINVTASGHLTQIALGEATAVDAKDGLVSPVASESGPFESGRHTITWSATDDAGNTATADQIVDVVPLINFGIDQIGVEGGSVTVTYELSGDAADYPVIFDYTVSGDAGVSDSDAVSGSAIINSGRSGSIVVNIAADTESDNGEKIIFSMSNISNAVSGTNTDHEITIVENNVPPGVTLNIEQSTENRAVVYQDQSLVRVSATAYDPNPSDVLSYDWSQTNTVVQSVNTNGLMSDYFEFDPATLNVGSYLIELNVSDGLSTIHVEVLLQVAATEPGLTTADSDGDGFADDVEGMQDTDKDGIEDYLDAISQLNILQNQTGNLQNQLLLQTETGLQVVVGQYAATTSRKGASIAEDDIVLATGLTTLPGLTINGETNIYDFEIHGLNSAQSSAYVVLPLQVGLQSGVDFYIFDGDNGWQLFAMNAANAISSASLNESGYCPVPSDSGYSTGMTVLDYCVQLLVEDGGPNDSDHEMNGVVRITGAVAYSQGNATDDDPKPADIGMLGPVLLAIVSLLLLLRRRRWM